MQRLPSLFLISSIQWRSAATLQMSVIKEWLQSPAASCSYSCCHCAGWKQGLVPAIRVGVECSSDQRLAHFKASSALAHLNKARQKEPRTLGISTPSDSFYACCEPAGAGSPSWVPFHCYGVKMSFWFCRCCSLLRRWAAAGQRNYDQTKNWFVFSGSSDGWKLEQLFGQKDKKLL